jgi:hypothetical protein
MIEMGALPTEKIEKRYSIRVYQLKKGDFA